MLVKSTLLLFMLAVSGPKDAMKPHIIAYIEQYKYMAIDEMERSGIPASVTMAQAIIESNAGGSWLARQSNNHFGIKCKSYWTGDATYHPDDDRDAQGNIIPSCFRKYESVQASFIDHTSFLMMTPHYQPLFGYARTDYESWARGLQLCGYATDPSYADKIIRTIQTYGLDELDYYTVKYVERSSLTSDSDVGANQ